MEFLIVASMIAVGVLFLCMPALMKAEARKKRRTDARYRPTASFGVLDEIFHPTAYSAFQQIEAEKQVPAPAPLPGDPLQRDA